MRRRKFIALIGGAAAAWPVIALGQQGERVRRIGLLTNLSASDSEGHARDEAFITELRQLGWAEGTNLQIDRRSTDGDAGLALQFAQELVALAPDVALRGHMGELGIVSAKGRNGTGELLRIIANGADSRVSPAVRGILEVLARQHSAIGAEIASIDRGIMALHRACEASRRLAEIPGIGPIGATALVAEIGDWNTLQSCGLDRAGAQAAQHRRQGQARQYYQAGQPIFAVVAGGRRNGCHPLRAQARNREAPMASPVDGTSTNQGGSRGARQQDCADGLGHHGPGREIQGAEAVAGGMRQASS